VQGGGAKSKDELLTLPAWQFYGFVAFGAVFSGVGGYLGGMTAVLFSNVMTTVAGASALGASTYFDVASGKFSPLLGHLDPAFYFGQVLAFFLGAALAGLVMGTKRKRWEGAQSATMWVEAAFLWLGFVLFPMWPRLSAYSISAAAGLQNSITSALSPIAFRTTHVSGTTVDLGNAFGFILRDGVRKHAWRVIIWGASYVGFVAGAFLGSFLALHLRHLSILIAAAAFSAAALGSSAATVALRRCNPRESPPPNFVALAHCLRLDDLYDYCASFFLARTPHVQIDRSHSFGNHSSPVVIHPAAESSSSSASQSPHRQQPATLVA
jgi:uncharacterized membrane protein YoaK (UPF0700 family)